MSIQTNLIKKITYNDVDIVINNPPTPISTEEEMNSLLIEENVGKIYRFMGPTRNYIYKHIYMVEDSRYTVVYNTASSVTLNIYDGVSSLTGTYLGTGSGTYTIASGNMYIEAQESADLAHESYTGGVSREAAGSSYCILSVTDNGTATQEWLV